MKNVSEINNKFANVSDLETLKAVYKELAKIYHPDRGGDTESMQLINGLYEKYSKKLSTSQDETDALEMFKDTINKIINFDGIEIEIIGNWIWISGNTYPIKDKLKECGALFSGARKMWYIRNEESKFYKRTNKQKDFEVLRAEYGSKIVKANNTKKISS